MPCRCDFRLISGSSRQRGLPNFSSRTWFRDEVCGTCVGVGCQRFQLGVVLVMFLSQLKKLAAKVGSGGDYFITNFGRVGWDLLGDHLTNPCFGEDWPF